MISKLFSKLNKIPGWVSIVVVIIACIFSVIPELLTFDNSIYQEALGLMDLTSGVVQDSATITNPAYKYVVVFFDAILTWIIMELVAGCVFNWAVRSRFTNRGKQQFLVATRLGYAVVMLLYGIFSFTALWAPAVYNFAYDIVLFVLRTAVFTIVYLGIKEDCVNDKFVFTLYNRLFTLYFTYNAVLYLLLMVMELLSTETIVVIAVVANAVGLAVVLIAGVILYFTVYKKLKKEQEENRKIILPPPTDGGNNYEIFKGYGM